MITKAAKAMQVFEGDTASEVWLKAAEELCTGGEWRSQASRVGATRELLHASFTIHDPRQRWVLSRLTPINPAFAIAEVVWIARGRNDSAFLNNWNSQLPKYAGHGDTYHGAYGFRLRRQFGLDQLERAYLALSNNPDSRQVVLQIWDSELDLPAEDGGAVNPDIPCNLLSLLKIREGKLEWMQIMRSNDLYRGVPYNFVQFTSLQEVMAGWLGVEVGTYNHLSDSLHIYDEDIHKAYSRSMLPEPVRPRLEACPNTDSLAVPIEISELAFSHLEQRIEWLASETRTRQELEIIGTQSEPTLPKAYYNLLLVLGAEAARRRGWVDISRSLMANNDNPMLQQAWKHWAKELTDRN